MRYEYRLPDIGEGIAEAELVGWHVKPGDRVEDGTMLADIMTDKATVEIEAPVSGIVTEQYGDVGDTVAIGSVLLVIETDEEEALTPSSTTPEQPPAQAVGPALEEEELARQRGSGALRRVSTPASAGKRKA